MIYIIKQEGLYQSMAKSSLVSIHNCKIAYYIQVKIIQPRLILYFLCFLALIIHELGLGDKGN